MLASDQSLLDAAAQEALSDTRRKRSLCRKRRCLFLEKVE
jgi:hypothetical protein